MAFCLVLGVDEDIIRVYNVKNIELLRQDLVDVSLKRDRCVGQSERHYLVLEVAVLVLEDCFLFVTFSDPHLIIGVGEVKLGKLPCST